MVSMRVWNGSPTPSRTGLKMNSPPYLVYRYTAPICPKPALCFLDEKNDDSTLFSKNSVVMWLFFIFFYIWDVLLFPPFAPPAPVPNCSIFIIIIISIVFFFLATKNLKSMQRNTLITSLSPSLPLSRLLSATRRTIRSSPGRLFPLLSNLLSTMRYQLQCRPALV